MFKTLIMAAAMAGASIAHAFTPQAGTWVVTAENNGEPGRGFGLDVQNSTLVMQMYAYDAGGNPVFYLSAGTLADNRYNGLLRKYRGGRFFGSGDLAGREDGDAGAVSMRFISGTRGYVTFPGEPEKEISRFNFGYTTAPEHLRGIWMLSALNRGSASLDRLDYFALEDAVQGSSYGTGAMVSRDRVYSCENLVSGPNAGLVMCLKFNTDSSLQRVNFFELSINDGEGVAGSSTQTADDVLYARRITNTTGDFTGIYYKSRPVEDSGEAAAVRRGAAEQAAALAVDRTLIQNPSSTPVPPERR